MKITSRIGKIFKPFVNFPRWMNTAQLMASGRQIIKSFQELKMYRPTDRQETFEEAMQRLHLNEEDIKKRTKNCLYTSIFYSFCALGFFIYSIYLMLHGFLGMIIAILITFLMAAFAYREHFWYFQLKTRQLGATPKQWLNFILRGDKRK